MNVYVRFLSPAFTALVVGAAPLAAQATEGPREHASPVAVVGMLPASLVDPAAPLLAPDLAGANARADSSTTSSVERGPTLASARVASHAVSTPRGAPPLIQNRRSSRNSVALMVVGGAALVIGAVIGDDAGTLVMLGGAAVGLYGLYLFLT